MIRNAYSPWKLAIGLACLAAGISASLRASEPPGRLLDNSDGTVTDTVTKLVWQKVWTLSLATDAGVTGTPTIAQGQSLCAGLSLGAFSSGWRLPSVKELVSIVDFESPTSPAIDTAAFPQTNGNPNLPYLTAETNSNGSALCVYFASGAISTSYCGTGSNTNFIRCVHGP
jgi:hypothetical protein